MTDQQPTPPTLLSQFRQRFVALYGILLLLGTISVVISLPSVTGITTSLDHLSTDLVYGLSGMLSLLITLPLLMASIVLLWHKHPAGIRLRLAAYGTAIASSVLAIFSSAETVDRLIKEAVNSAQQFSSGVDTALLESVASSSFYGSLYMTIALNLILAWLWLHAWKKQVKRDRKRSA